MAHQVVSTQVLQSKVKKSDTFVSAFQCNWKKYQIKHS